MNPLVSVIVPVYRAEAYIGKCVESILHQTYRNLEIILVDDGSPDRCPEICDKYKQADQRICVIHQQNSGVSAARNAGISQAHGKWITFADSDDFCRPQWVEVMIRHAMETGAELSICDYSMQYDEEIPKAERIQQVSVPLIEQMLLDRNTAMYWALLPDYYQGYSFNKIFQLSIIQDNHLCFDKSISIQEDSVFLISYLRFCTTIFYDSIPLYVYIQHKTGTINSLLNSEQFQEKWLTEIAAFELIRTYLPENRKMQNLLIAKSVCSASNCSRRLVPHREFKTKQKELLRYVRMHLGILLRSNLFSLKSKIGVVVSALSPKLGYLELKWKMATKRRLNFRSKDNKL